MIYTIVANNNNEILNSYLLSSLKSVNTELYLIKGKENIYEKYNIGIDKIKSKILNDDDIICFIHEDVKILDQYFEEKLNYIFKEKPNVGLCGVIGTNELLENGSWWINSKEKKFGHIIQENGKKIYHFLEKNVGYFEDMVIVDGLFLAIRGELINKGLRFNESFKSFHLYDLTICFQVLEMGYKIACVDILLQHKSPGLGFLTKEWVDMKDKFISSVKNKGYKFPITSKNFNKEKK